MGPVVLVIAATGGLRWSNEPSGGEAGASTGSHAFLTADTLPVGVAGRTATPFRLADGRGGSLASVSRRGRRFHSLIGSQRALTSVWKGYSAAPQIPGDPQSSHTAAIWLIDRHGRLAALIDAGVALDVIK